MPRQASASICLLSTCIGFSDRPGSRRVGRSVQKWACPGQSGERCQWPSAGDESGLLIPDPGGARVRCPRPSPVARRRGEATDLLGQETRHLDGLAVGELRADDLEANRQPLWGQADGRRCRRQIGGGGDTRPEELVLIRHRAAVHGEEALVPVGLLVVWEGGGERDLRLMACEASSGDESSSKNDIELY
jgi:hypothetical protein